MIDKVPPSLSWDEASIGYDAYSILKTGKDQWGETYPLAFKSFGEYKYPFHIYASIIPIYFFGLNEFAVRYPSALFGVFNILLLYLLVFKLFKNQFIALTSAFLLAISPWHIQFSRVSWETNFAFFFFLLGMLFFFKSNQDKKNYFLILSFILFGITTYTYNGAKVFIVLFIPLLLFSQRNYLLKQKKYLFFSVMIFFGFLAMNLLDPRLSGINRFKQLDFIQADIVKTISYQVTKVYPLGKVELTARQYLTYFYPKFLFISGDTNLRHSTQAVGQVYWMELLPVFFGVFFLFKKEPKLALLILGWFLLAPIPGSFTREAPHASRGMFILGVWHILAATGIYYLYSLSRNYKKYFIIIFFVLMFATLINYYIYYLHEYPKVSSESWKYGYKQAVEYIGRNYQNYDLIVMTRSYGEPQIFTLFYLKFDPYKYQTDQNLIRERVGDWIQVSGFDKFIFPDLNENSTRYEDIVSENPDKKILFVGKKGDFPENLAKLEVINFLDGTRAFEIVEAR